MIVNTSRNTASITFDAITTTPLVSNDNNELIKYLIELINLKDYLLKDYLKSYAQIENSALDDVVKSELKQHILSEISSQNIPDLPGWYHLPILDCISDSPSKIPHRLLSKYLKSNNTYIKDINNFLAIGDPKLIFILTKLVDTLLRKKPTKDELLTTVDSITKLASNIAKSELEFSKTNIDALLRKNLNKVLTRIDVDSLSTSQLANLISKLEYFPEKQDTLFRKFVTREDITANDALKALSNYKEPLEEELKILIKIFLEIKGKSFRQILAMSQIDISKYPSTPFDGLMINVIVQIRNCKKVPQKFL